MAQKDFTGLTGGFSLGFLAYFWQQFFGLNTATYFSILALSTGIVVSDFLLRDNGLTKFFRNAGLKNKDEEYPHKIRKIKKEYGYDMLLTIPKGLCLSDFKKKQEAIEQYLDANVDIQTYKNHLLLNVHTERLQNTYDFKIYKTLKDVEIIIGYSREGLQTLDLNKEVHLLVAGETGAGKSVFLRNVITTLILTKKPSRLELHLVDFKRVELGIFKQSKFVKDFCTTFEEFNILLQKLKSISDKRFMLMEKHNVVNIENWNKQHSHKFKHHIVVIDEFAVLSCKNGKELLATLQTRLALDRAAGIHYILCTQRPSHTILPGNLKANVPAKLAFRTSTRINSEIILDQTGAETLQGKGQGLLLTDKLTKIQTMYLSETKARELIKHTFVEKKEGKNTANNKGVLQIANKKGQTSFTTNRKI